jgi:hypothetical protein
VGAGTPITADSKLNDVLARYPGAGPIFFQAGRVFIAKASDLAAQYPGLTIGEYARLNGLDAAALVRRVQAEAESAEAQRPGAAPDEDAPSRRRTVPTLGYTGSHRAGEDSGEGTRSVVSVQSAHGPE